MSNSADPVFESEQQHLKEVYSALVEAETELHSRIESIDARAAADKASMAEDIRPSFAGDSDTLTPDNVVLMTPNSKFQDYIEEVLPELGEGNPNMHTWDSLLEEIAEGVTKNNESLTSRTILSRIEQEFAKDEPSSPFLKAECVRYVLIDEVQDYTIKQLEAIAAYYPRAHFLMLGDPNQALSDGLASFDEIRMLFAKLKGFVSEAHLSLSYRSTIEITRAFASLADPATDFCIESVLRDGPVPEVLECGCEEEYAHTLATVIEEITVGSAAIVVLQRNEIEYFRSVVSALRMQGNVRADCEIEVLTLQEAKGLEFDHVILADVSSRSIESSDLWRRMLYTAVSRATRSLTALSRGQASSILKAAFRRCCESLG